MYDDLDASLMRRFAAASERLPAEPFLAALAERLHGRRSFAGGAYSVLGTILGGLADGIFVPLRLKLTRYVMLGAAAVTLISVFG